ncbi:MAG: response regulator transcription factor [Chloroflexota bacterium]
MSEAHPIRVLVVDDHKILRIGLAVFLENYDDMILVGEASNGQEAVDLFEQLQPDIVLMDLRMPVMDGITATSVILHNFPLARIIVLTSSFSPERQQEAVDAGAFRLLRKNISIETLASAIWEAVDGTRS